MAWKPNKISCSMKVSQIIKELIACVVPSRTFLLTHFKAGISSRIPALPIYKLLYFIKISNDIAIFTINIVAIAICIFNTKNMNKGY